MDLTQLNAAQLASLPLVFRDLVLTLSRGYIDAELIFFYTMVTILFSVMLSFDKTKKLWQKLQSQLIDKTAHKVRNNVRRVNSFKRKMNVMNKLSGLKLLPGRTLFQRLSVRKQLSLSKRLVTSHRHYFNRLTSLVMLKRNRDEFIDYSDYVNGLLVVNRLKLNSVKSAFKYLSFVMKIFMSSSDRKISSNRHLKIKTYNSRVKLYKKLPLRSMSRLWGVINSLELPVWSRKPCYKLYAWLFQCNLNEMDIDDLTHYKNLSEFFRRKLKPNARQIDESSSLISPCDGRVLHFGKVDKGYLEQVKGVNYSLKAFLGEPSWSDGSKVRSDDERHEEIFKLNKDTDMYHCIIYLAPGDYHRFHSPSDWNIHYRRHFPGELFSVNPSVARWLQGLFNLNERVVYYGEWKYGFFSMTPVGATNVGSIRVYADPGLETNLKPDQYKEDKLEKDFRLISNAPANGISVNKGDYFGEFNLGSTIVLVFEAPKNFEFNIKQNQKVYFGQPLGSFN